MTTNTIDIQPAATELDLKDSPAPPILGVPIQHPTHDHLESTIGLIASQLQESTANSGLGSGGWDLISFSNDWIFRNDQDQLVARVARSQHDLDEVRRQTDLARQLVAIGVPATPLASNLIERLPAGRYVSFWRLAEDRLQLEAAELAELASHWHQTRPIVGLKPWWPHVNFDFHRQRLEALTKIGLPERCRQKLGQLLEQRWQRLLEYESQPGGYGLIHGDFWHTNVVRLDGRLQLCDLEAVAIGPREKDLSAIAVDLNHYLADPNSWSRFLNRYQPDYDPRRLALFIDVQEITDLMWLTGFWQRSPDSRDELIRRLDNFETPNYRWTLPLGTTYHRP